MEVVHFESYVVHWCLIGPFRFNLSDRDVHFSRDSKRKKYLVFFFFFFFLRLRAVHTYNPLWVGGHAVEHTLPHAITYNINEVIKYSEQKLVL